MDSAGREQAQPEAKLGPCVIKDDVNDIMAKVLKADIVYWATSIARSDLQSDRCEYKDF